ncbi:MAG: hypothetical protein JNM12_04285 [Alphaproteobacteria bacterium]|nr:hypothetical protein [Alphaproteobacteria bacterium]
MGLPHCTIAETPTAAIWTPKRVAVAARSIATAGEVHFACCGLVASDGFDAAARLTAALESGSLYSKKIDAALAAIEEPLAVALNAAPPEAVKKHLSKNALEILLFGIDHGEMTLTHIAFKTKKRGKDMILQPQRRDYPNAGTNMMSVEIVTACAGDIDAVLRKEITGQQALVYPEQSLQKFLQLAQLYPACIAKLTAEGLIRQEIESA